MWESLVQFMSEQEYLNRRFCLTTGRRILKVFYFHSSLVKRSLIGLAFPKPLKQSSFRLSSWIKTVIFLKFGRNVDVRINISLSSSV